MKSSYRFIKVPLCLFSDSYSKLSVEAKILYAFLLDRLTLSEKNGFSDENGSIFVYYPNSEVCRTFCCGSQKATRLFRELEKYKLINRRNQGRGKPDIIYVNQYEVSPTSLFKKNDNQHSGVTKTNIPEYGKSPPINTEYIYTEDSHINQSISYSVVKEEIRDQIEYEVLLQRDYGGILDEIVNLITDTYCSPESYVRIGKREITIQTVRQRLLMLTAEHIEYVISSLEKNTTEIKNMRAYMLTSIYNSIDTLEADGLYGN